MLDIKIDTTQLDAYADKLAGHESYYATEARAAMQKSVDTVLAAVVGRVPVNTGKLRSSITGEVTGTTVSLQGVVTSPLQPHYAPDVEYGRKPGKMPPIDAIQLWARRKTGLSGPALRSVSFLIARAIGKRGTKGAFMFRDGTEAARGTVARIWEGVMERVLRRIAA